jgi:hypothetical protein
MLMAPLVISAAKQFGIRSLFIYEHFHLRRDLTHTRQPTVALIPQGL